MSTTIFNKTLGSLNFFLVAYVFVLTFFSPCSEPSLLKKKLSN